MTPFVKKGAFLVLALLLKIFNVFYQHYFIKFYIKNPKRCLPITNPSLLKTASQLSEEIRNRKISSESVVMEDSQKCNVVKDGELKGAQSKSGNKERIALTTVAAAHGETRLMTSFVKKGSFLALALLLKILKIFCQFYFIKFYFKKPKRCPTITNPLLLKTASQLSEEIRNRKISSESVVRAYISRVKNVNPILNAVMEDRFEIAIQEAKLVDISLMATNLNLNEVKNNSPLLGVPITIKESIAVENLSNTGGATGLKGVKATEDADVVKLLRISGAIVLLVSTTPEYCVSLETYNKISGTTYNPYDTRRTAGGSSGGEAALISSGASLIGIGSDLIGSVRLPACFCGIWGHKFSREIVSTRGHIPTSEDATFKSMFTFGPLTRYYTDLPLLFNIIVEKNSKSAISLNSPIKLPKTGGYSFLYMEKLGSIKGVEDILENYSGNYFKELLLHLIGKSHITFTHTCLGILNCVYRCLGSTDNSDEHVNTIRNQLQDTLGSNGVLLLPTHPTAANFHGGVTSKLYDYGYTAIINILGLPATQCPVGLNSAGLPLGVQVISATCNDRLTLRVAEEIDKLFGGWIPPPFSE
ncbi:fatty-acid amide hydrolase 2-B-like isoform X2 [Photinus pyralis]|uniref:fatty-acid amide hydrolase 2-B-like isoform X2 n=1 Tax=Photinus pyralis TaxID=7054 RepID=UPI001266F8D0|nr:fatty-acid amide hydrolase 2-B-like isoform X2 [Photinus pyralis]